MNLHLSVGRLRDDGFHDLTTVFHAVDLLDEVVLRRAPSLSVEVSGEGAAAVPHDETNLAARAVLLLAQEHGVDPAVAIRIRKGIPVAGGCAGGSADAAAALVAADALHGLGLSREQLSELGARLGSDVPFSLHGGTALGTGRGEQLTPVLVAGTYSWVLALAEGGLSTPEVYGELDRQRLSGTPGLESEPSRVLTALRTGDARALGRALHNDLQPAALALRPSLRPVLRTAEQLGALGAVVSGSGPTVVLLAADEEHATDLSAGLAASGTCRAVRTATGPVAGARVVETS